MIQNIAINAEGTRELHFRGSLAYKKGFEVTYAEGIRMEKAGDYTYPAERKGMICEMPDEKYFWEKQSTGKVPCDMYDNCDGCPWKGEDHE